MNNQLHHHHTMLKSRSRSKGLQVILDSPMETSADHLSPRTRERERIKNRNSGIRTIASIIVLGLLSVGSIQSLDWHIDVITESNNISASTTISSSQTQQNQENEQEQKEMTLHTQAVEKIVLPGERHSGTNWNSILPKRVITIFGAESSGTTFLGTTLAIAAGVIEESEGLVGGARNANGSIEMQHLSLPWGSHCESETDLVRVVDAMVPVECSRLEDHEVKKKKTKKKKKKTPWMWMEKFKRGNQRRLSSGDVRQICRHEVSIFNESKSCGAKCGVGELNGYALYPRRFSVNITSHIDWYLQRGVDVTVIISTRDKSISMQGKKKNHCNFKDAREHEDEMALEIMREGLEKYGPFGSIEKDRVIVSPYEALMGLQNEYLFDLYKQLGIKSTYIPSYKDGNKKYVIDDNANVTNAGTHIDFAKEQAVNLSEPMMRNNTTRQDSLLPKKLITVVGLERPGVSFLSDALREASSKMDGFRVQHLQLFNVNLSSHIQWNLVHDVDVQVVVLVRDKTISIKERLRQSHNHVSPEQVNSEYDAEMKIIREAYLEYGKDRVLIVSYEGLMQLKKSYLFVIYKRLGIESTYLPDFIDKNELHVAPIDDDTSIGG